MVSDTVTNYTTDLPSALTLGGAYDGGVAPPSSRDLWQWAVSKLAVAAASTIRKEGRVAAYYPKLASYSADPRHMYVCVSLSKPITRNLDDLL